MALDATALLINVKKSVRKYFLDNLYTTAGYEVTFDMGFTPPKVQGLEKDNWYSINFIGNNNESKAEQAIDIVIASRIDPEGDVVMGMRDTLFAYLIGDGGGQRSITLYNCANPASLVSIGGMLIIPEPATGVMEAEDSTKYIMQSIRLLYGVKI
jgi:hypothetical protein